MVNQAFIVSNAAPVSDLIFINRAFLRVEDEVDDEGTVSSRWEDEEEGNLPPRSSKNAYKLFKKRHLVNLWKMPRDDNGWNNLMDQGRLNNRNHSLNTFIMGFPSDLSGPFTEPVGWTMKVTAR